MEPSRVFVASSSEGEEIAGKLRSRLQEELGATALVELWKHKFALGATTIESLETISREVDFAVLVMTPDDITVSRHKEKLSPRDNLIFELGLFIGALGRDRSIIAQDHRQDLKLPSDMLGVTTLRFDATSSDLLMTSLHDASLKLAERIKDRGPRRAKRLAQGSLAENEEFCRHIEGAWWQKIHHKDGSAISFFTITTDPLAVSVTFQGTSYGKDGQLSARWRSEMSRLYPAEHKLAYLWRGKHPLPGFAHLDFHGYGTMEFKASGRGSSEFTHGNGDFWDVEQHSPQNTVVKPFQLARVVNETHRQIMSSGTSKEKHDLVIKVLME